MKLDIHCVAMVQAPAIVNCSLPKDCDWKLLVEGVGKEPLNLPRVTKTPTTGACETCKRRCTDQTPLRVSKILCDLRVCLGLDQHTGNLRLGIRHLAIKIVDLFFGKR